jgi:hypothetical protein
MTPTPRVLLPSGISASLEEYKLILERKRAAIQQICQGLEEYFTIDLDAAIEAITNPTGMPLSATLYPLYKPSDEEFARVCEQVETMERRLEESQRAYHSSGEEGPEGAMRATMGAQMQFMEDSLRSLKSQRDAMQKQMEESSEATS